MLLKILAQSSRIAARCRNRNFF